MPLNPVVMAIVMTRDPVLMNPVRLNPFSVFVVVAFNVHLPARRAGAYINGCDYG